MEPWHWSNHFTYKELDEVAHFSGVTVSFGLNWEIDACWGAERSCTGGPGKRACKRLKQLCKTFLICELRNLNNVLHTTMQSKLL